MPDFSSAMQEWGQLLGSDRVSSDGNVLDRYGTNINALYRRVRGVLYPETTKEVQEVVRIARKRGVSLYPESTKQNHGLGGATPVQDDCVVVDLGRMNKISVNEEYHYALIEPGVTQGQLYEHLEQDGIPLMFDATGAGTRAGFVGNAAEGGVGYFSLRFDQVSDYTAVLGTGEIFETGFPSGSSVKYLFRYPPGMFLDGLFKHSNLGIITKIKLGLMPHPEYRSMLLCSIGSEESFPYLVDGLRKLRDQGTIQTVVKISNDSRSRISIAPLLYRELMQRGTYGDSQSTRTFVENTLRRKSGPWSAITSLLGTRSEVRSKQREIRKVLGNVGKVEFITDNGLDLNGGRLQVGLDWGRGLMQAGRFLSRPFGDRPKRFIDTYESLMESLLPLYHLATRGKPTDAPLLSLYWPLGDIPENWQYPEQIANCGMQFKLPLIPMNGMESREAVRKIRETIEKYGFEPAITLNTVEKAFDTVTSIPFNRSDAEEVERASECEEELFHELAEFGDPDYRFGIGTMGRMSGTVHPYYRMLYRALKNECDPDYILAPGRYEL